MILFLPGCSPLSSLCPRRFGDGRWDGNSLEKSLATFPAAEQNSGKRGFSPVAPRSFQGFPEEPFGFVEKLPGKSVTLAKASGFLAGESVKGCAELTWQ